jgi:hypothetical protein
MECALPALRALLLLLTLAQPVAAEDWSVLVIGNPSRSAPSAFADSHAAAEVFRGMGLGRVTLQREIGADALAASLDSLQGAPRAMIYFAGPIGSGSSGPMLMGQGGGDPRGAITPLLTRLADSGTTQIVLLIEDCAGGTGLPGRLVAPELPPQATVYMAASAGTAEACPPKADRLTDRLTQAPGETLQDRLAGLWTGAATLAPVPVAQTILDAAPEADAPVVTTASEVIRVAPAAIAALSPTEVIAGSALAEPAEPGADAATEPAVFRPLRDEDILAIPVAAGMPRPSIIVGLIRPAEPEPEPEPELPQIVFDDLAAREALRTDNPDLFQTLVNAGGLDPPPESLIIALQTELQRSGCYTAAVDGQWGNGSRRAVDRFAETAGLAPVTREAEVGLYRQILLTGPVDCPAPVAEPARATTPRAADPAPSTARSAPAPTPAPAPDPAPPSGGLSNSALGGVFR